MTQGHVYIMTNPSMPGLVKIGMTTRGLAHRANELWSTGVPTPFDVAASYFAPDCEWLEREAHKMLAESRVTASREFFRISTEEAEETIGFLLRSYLENYVSRFWPDALIINRDFDLAVQCVRSICQEHNVSPDVAAKALRKVDAAAMVEAIEDAAEQDAKAKEELAIFGPEETSQSADDWW